ncbi:hypothetical protein PPERSA_05991 [Pseudocohnilembus persalinus]|uniref:Uncharacterized protein n=1 Tax=Pseudocohnilembus persalinus TaxID=266149 RepID=A0A0V0Q7F0_PSEPJ|nr:hypothetical protein PPERSA_05991 [Pseudocohnilembus persalinus]|eukprot:KRW98095.1 hypothetical protein PPERSA_05991 [Pseudocohnilembus persalinus]
MYKRIVKNYRTVEQEEDLEDINIQNEELDKIKNKELLQQIDQITAANTKKQEKFYQQKYSQQNEQEEEKQEKIKQHFCTLCNEHTEYNQKSLDKHLESDLHQKNFNKFKKRYRQFIRNFRNKHLKNPINPRKNLDKLKLFRKSINFE